MKFNIFPLFVAVFCAIAMGCGTPKETTKTSSSEKVNSPTPQAIALQEGAAEDATVADQRERDLTEGIEKMTGSEIIEESAKRLKNKLSTNDEVYQSINEILKDTFLDSGNELSNSYVIGDARIIGKEIIRSSANRIADLLDQDQMTKFKTLLQN